MRGDSKQRDGPNSRNEASPPTPTEQGGGERVTLLALTLPLASSGHRGPVLYSRTRDSPTCVENGRASRALYGIGIEMGKNTHSADRFLSEDGTRENTAR